MEKYVGNITKDATGKDVNGNHVTNFTIAVNRPIRKDGQWTKKAVYLHCALWGNEKVEPYLTKSAIVDVSGDTDADYFQKKDGVIISFLKLTVRELNLHYSGKGNPHNLGTGTEPEPASDLPC